MSVHRYLAKVFYRPFPEIIWQLPPEQNTLYLTFDDGPYPPATAPLLEWLRENHAPAAFFLSGENLFRWRRQLDDLSYQGHDLGSHAFFHLPVNLLSPKNLRRSLDCCDALMEQQLGRRPALFRPPYGIFSASLRKILRRRQQRLVLWSLMANDFRWPPERVLKHLCSSARPGDILVFHDSPLTEQRLMEIIPRFVEHCRERGWQFARLSDALQL